MKFEKAEQPTISIRTNTKVENLPMLIGESYGKMAAYLKELEEFLSDVPYVAYHNVDIQNLDVEIGFPVSKPLPGIGRFSQILFRLERLSFACIAGHTVRWKRFTVKCPNG
ncbi:MAG: hypothetical protein AAGU75_15920 [Bacillota bacterium]|uniref:hypothetical protein n=1 Tax=Desulfitobacterium hafniense TaxID=49338 RepID=UPI00039CA9F5|nr:hypothetical protein [Desulfitobacterium hafniense]